ncbi:MAG: YARHG domain-containing protein [Bacteroidaceae bacterium]|nr:YARHG domain-containing protein [Bacteroidaceae bacterium]
MKVNFFVATLMWLMALVAKANDGTYYVNGNQLVPLQETDVAVTKEVLTISIRDDGFAAVDVYYEFTNRGKAKVVDMGFEAQSPYNAGDALQKTGKHPYIHDFTVEMNGERLAIRNYVMKAGDSEDPADFVPLDLTQWRDLNDQDDEMSGIINKKTNENIEYSYAYCFKANFKEGKNVVHHTYRYRMSEGVYNHFNVPYWLKPAMRWANHQIDDFTLRIKAEKTSKQFCIAKDKMWEAASWRLKDGTGKMHVIKSGYDVDYYEFSLRNGTYEWHALNFRPTDNISIQSAEGAVFAREDFKLGRFYDRTAVILVPYEGMEETEDGYQVSTKNTTDGIPNSRILRNLPYAARGYVFKDQKLAAYFKSLWWYMPDPSWQQSTSDFTKQEREWITK